jgi:hypothetical protein
MITGASSNPFAAFRSPVVALKEKRAQRGVDVECATLLRRNDRDPA